MERTHQTLNKRLTALPPAATTAELQDQINDIRAYYNSTRPHRALRRRTPIQAFTDRPKASPDGQQIPPHYRLRHDSNIRVLDRTTGTQIRKLILDPTRDYRPRGVKCGNSPENRL